VTTQIKGTYEITGWEEAPYDEKKGTVKLTQAHVTNAFKGDIEGKGTAEYLMTYPSDTSASFIGLQRVVGTLDGRKGSFVLQATGTFENGQAKADWFVVPESGTGDLKGLQGKGGYASKEDGSCDIKLSYSFV
jgi:hypothetical protein